MFQSVSSQHLYVVCLEQYLELQDQFHIYHKKT